ncbi:MAG: hypothetical protein KC636_11720 [Myxococcales bacterium]|nr:hypothetical protein [Myxococcales bacterium]
MIIVCPTCSDPFELQDGHIAPLVQLACPHCNARHIFDFAAANDPSLLEAGHGKTVGFASAADYHQFKASGADAEIEPPQPAPIQPIAEPVPVRAVGTDDRMPESRRVTPTPEPEPVPTARENTASGGMGKFVPAEPEPEPAKVAAPEPAPAPEPEPEPAKVAAPEPAPAPEPEPEEAAPEPPKQVKEPEPAAEDKTKPADEAKGMGIGTIIIIINVLAAIAGVYYVTQNQP